MRTALPGRVEPLSGSSDSRETVDSERSRVHRRREQVIELELKAARNALARAEAELLREIDYGGGFVEPLDLQPWMDARLRIAALQAIDPKSEADLPYFDRTAEQTW